MAGPCTRCNAGGASSNGSDTSVSTPGASYTPTFVPAQIPVPTEASAPTQVLTPTPALASALGPPGRYTDKNLQRATKLALELFVKGQKFGQLQANSTSRKQPLKVRFLDLYYRNSHLDSYCFCQQCKDHFKTAGTNRPNQVLFAALFLCRVIVQQ